MDTVIDVVGAAERAWAWGRHGDAAMIRTMNMRAERDAKFRDLVFILVSPGGRIEAGCPDRVRTG
jgi:hypothetical protein